MAFSVDIGDFIAGMALLLSGYATFKTVKFSEHQKSLNELQKKVNLLLLAKEESQATEKIKADLGARIVSLGESKFVLKVWNQGKAVARNVRIGFPEGNSLFMQSEIDSKFPFEILEQHQSLDLFACIEFGTEHKHVIELFWDDDSGENRQKKVFLTI